MFPTTSLIICSRNRPGLLSDTVKSIHDGNSLPTELVIIDQSDLRNDALASTIGPPGCEIRYLWTHSVGLGRARNAGIAAARYDVIVFIDDDMRVTANWFENLISAIVSGGDRAVVTGQVLPAEPDIEGGFAPSVKEDTNPAVFEGRVGRDVLFTNNMATWRTVMETVGPFDDEFGTGSRFPSSEDNDYGFRLLEAGYRIHYVPQACVYHRCWRPERDYLPLCWNYGLGQGAFYAKYSSLRDQFMLRRMCKDGELSVGVRKSETVALRHPVMPVGNGFGGRVVGIDSRQLGQGDGHGPALPADQHEHIGGAGIFRCHTLDFDGFPFPEKAKVSWP